MIPVLEHSGFSRVQTYFPLMKYMFRLRDPGRIINRIQLGGSPHIMKLDMERGEVALRTAGMRKFFLKAIPIYDPILFIQGQYTYPNGQPNRVGIHKIATYFNEAYVETVITYILQEIGGFPKL